MTISGFGNGIYLRDDSLTKREDVFVKDLNQDLFNPNKRRIQEAELLKEEWEERQKRLENLSSMEGMPAERKLERVQSLQGGMDELRGEYNQIRQFRIPEEMKENAKRLAEAIQRIFPQPVLEEEPIDEQQELSEAVQAKEENDVVTNGESQVKEEASVSNGDQPRITENIFDKSERMGLRDAKEYVLDTREKIDSEEERTDKNILNREEPVNRNEDIRIEEEKGKDKETEQNEDEEDGALANLRKTAEERNDRAPKITEYVFREPEREVKSVAEQNNERARMNQRMQWEIEGKLTA